MMHYFQYTFFEIENSVRCKRGEGISHSVAEVHPSRKTARLIPKIRSDELADDKCASFDKDRLHFHFIKNLQDTPGNILIMIKLNNFRSGYGYTAVTRKKLS